MPGHASMLSHFACLSNSYGEKQRLLKSESDFKLREPKGDLKMRQSVEMTDLSTIVSSPNSEKSERDICSLWTDEMIAAATPEIFPLPASSKYQIRSPELSLNQNPQTFIPPNIAHMPYASMCKVYYMRGSTPYVASAWIVHGNTEVKGIITSGHVVYNPFVRDPEKRWSHSYLVLRQYSEGIWAEKWTSNFARTLNGWIKGSGTDCFWDIGAIIPNLAISTQTPSLGVVWNYNYNSSPFNYFYDVGYPGKPANGYPFNGEILWESDGSLIQTHHYNDQIIIEAYNAMEQGSSGSPWLVLLLADKNLYFLAAGIQSTGWDGVPSSYSPYFCQRNILALLIDINVWI
jgi:hypothetical protein